MGIIPLPPILDKPIQLVMVDKLLNLVLELNALLYVMVMVVVVMVKTVLVWIAPLNFVYSLLTSGNCLLTYIKICVHGVFKGVYLSNFLGDEMFCWF